MAARCRSCPLWRDATQVVFGGGPADAKLILVTDLRRAGQLLPA